MVRGATPGRNRQDLHAMPLWGSLIILAAVIAAGSLHPFEFDRAAFDGPWLADLLASWDERTSRGDVVGNIGLFVPWGLLGMAQAQRWQGAPRTAVAIMLIIAGAALALAMQIGQIAVPGRTPTLVDVWLNIAGIFAGIALWSSVGRLVPRAVAISVPLSGLALAGLWLAVTTMPLVPTIDWQAWKDSLRPLLLEPRFEWVNFLFGWAAWFAVGSLLESPQTTRVIPLAILLAGGLSAGLQILVVSASVSVHEVAAMLAAAASWKLALPFSISVRRAMAAGGLYLAWAIAALTPFTPSSAINSFNWIPFGEYIVGSILTNLVNMMETVFVFAGFLLLLSRNGVPVAVAALPLLILVLLTEFAQVFLAGRTPGISDAILVVIVALSVPMLRQADEGRVLMLRPA
jgi:VanZ family protein